MQVRPPLAKSQQFQAYGNVFLDYPPIVNPRWVVENNAVITVGDLHANAKKLLYILKSHQFFDIPDKDYITVCKICNKPVDLLVQYDIDTFNSIIDNMQVNPNALTALLRIMGDDLGDRGPNDYFVLKILQKMAKSGVKFRSILSNHVMDFILRRESGLPFEFPVEPDQRRSIHNLQKLIDLSLIDEDEVVSIYFDVYLPHLKIIDYSFDVNGKLTIYTHAPSGRNFIKDLVEDINEYNGVTVVKYLDETPLDLSKTIDEINRVLLNLATKGRLYHFYKNSKNNALEKIIWNRDYNQDVLGRNPNDNYVNGHDLDLKKISSDNVRGLDNRCGYGDIYSEYQAVDEFKSYDNYFILYTNDQKQPKDSNFYYETVEDLIASTNKLLCSVGLTNIVLPENKSYDFYNTFYNILLLLINDNLHQKRNIIKTLSVCTSLSDDEVQSFCNALVQLRYSSGKLAQKNLDDLVQNNGKNIKSILKFKYLYNLVRVFNPNITDGQLICLNTELLHEVLSFCNANNFINYGIYQCILSHLDQLDKLASIEYFDEFKDLIYSLGIDKKYMLKKDIVDMLVKMHTNRADLDEDVLKILHNYYNNNFNNEQLIYISKFLISGIIFLKSMESDTLEAGSESSSGESTEVEEKGEAVDEIHSEIHLLRIVVNMWRILGDDIMKKHLPIIFASHNPTGILQFFDVFFKLISGTHSLTKCLTDAIDLDRFNLLTKELVDWFSKIEDPCHVIKLIDCLKENKELSKENLDLIIQNPTITNDDLLSTITKREVCKIFMKNEMSLKKMIIVDSSSSSSSSSSSDEDVDDLIVAFGIFKNEKKGSSPENDRDSKPGLSNQ